MTANLILKNHSAMRRFLLTLTNDLTEDQIRIVPAGAVNNILWNLEHVIADECNMVYTPSGLPSPLPKTFHAMFDPGTAPAEWEFTPNIEDIKNTVRSMEANLTSDYRAGKFANFEAYSIAESYRLETVDEAIAYCSLHEAMHIGINITLRRVVAGMSSTH